MTAACSGSRSPPLSPDRTVITTAEIARWRGGATALDLVRDLRPQFLAARGKSSLMLYDPGGPDVFVDGMYLGSTAWLAQIPASDVALVRFYRAGQAPVALGGSHPQGVIVIVTKH